MFLAASENIEIVAYQPYWEVGQTVVHRNGCACVGVVSRVYPSLLHLDVVFDGRGYSETVPVDSVRHA